MESKYVAILMERIIIDNNTFVFKKIHVLEGNYDEKYSIFVDKYNNTYSDVLTSDMTIDNTNEFFAFPTSICKLKEQFKCDDECKVIEEYSDRLSENIYIGIINDVEEFMLITIPIDDITNYKELNTKVKNLENNNEEDTYSEKNRFYFEEETIHKLLNTNDIDELKKYINNFYERYNDENAEIEDTIPEIKKSLDTNIPFDVNDLYKYVTSKVINQDEAVKKIIMIFIYNYLAVSSNKISDFKPTRCLITGPTGVGKTLILETIMEYLEKETKIKIPMVKVATSQLTVAGYVGDNLEDILSSLVSKVSLSASIENKIKYAERTGIIFFDEIDKKGSKSNGDVSGRGVLNSLLQFFDGADYQISVNRVPYIFNTKYLNLFAGGAFSNVSQSINKQQLGFGNTNDKVIKEVTTNDYINVGLIPNEFMGRLHQIIKLNPLGFNELVDILKTPSSSPISIEKKLLELNNINLSYDESYLKEVAKRANELNLGARSLKTIIEDSLSELKWDALISNEKNITYEVTDETVIDPKQYKKII
ncbi:MAG: AAA family ATPase [Clostridium sp.]|nr:AAA family ATPase [Clostridium sp.]MCM1443968.1 AAA family ATPase [Candidatus Amulumruptor caecigallinarius]